MSKVVLITGGAGGIGEAIALELARNGYDIVINYLTSEEKALRLKEQICSEFQVRCLVLKADISSEAECDAMVSEIENRMGSVDVLVNNAAVDFPNLFHMKTAEEFRRTLDVNVVGAYLLSRRVYPHMKENGWGRIINISSTNGMNTYYPMCFDYDVSKAALNQLTHDLAVQFAPDVHVNAIAPGFIGTAKELEGYDEEFLRMETEKILLGRYGDPKEVAYLVRFLISNEADYINNTIIRIDGGQMGSL